MCDSDFSQARLRTVNVDFIIARTVSAMDVTMDDTTFVAETGDGWLDVRVNELIRRNRENHNSIHYFC